MAAERQDELLDHNYDGIQEYDNSLPRWWVYLLWGTIVWSVAYVGYFHFGPGLSQVATLQAEIKDSAALHATATGGELTEANLLALLADSARAEKGRMLFSQKCASCHGAQAQGLVGPNLTDDNWIHGGHLTEIRKTILDGVPAKGMLSWRGLLTDEEVTNVVLFIRSIRGTNPPNPKAPEGNPFTP